VTIDIAALRALLAERDTAIADLRKDSPLSRGVLGDVQVELATAAVNALPELLAIAEAAGEFVESNRTADPARQRRAHIALAAAVDAARKERS
jgi:hypothetical protein